MILAMTAAALLTMADDGPKPAERARANLSEYFSADDYPETAARRGIQGTTGFRLDVGADGRVTNCVVTASSGDPALDSATCSVLFSRAEYLPARDASGRAIAGSNSGRVTWRLPAPEPEPFASVRAPVRIDVTIRLDEAREVICTVLINGRPGGTDGDAFCATALASAGPPPDHVAANVEITMGVAIGLESAPPPPVNLDRGMLMADATARLTVAGDGRVAHCEVVETNYHNGLPAALGAPDLCSFPALQGKLFPGTPAGGGERPAVMRMELYLRTGPRRST